MKHSTFPAQHSCFPKRDFFFFDGIQYGLKLETTIICKHINGKSVCFKGGSHVRLEESGSFDFPLKLEWFVGSWPST